MLTLLRKVGVTWNGVIEESKNRLRVTGGGNILKRFKKPPVTKPRSRRTTNVVNTTEKLTSSKEKLKHF